MSWRWFKSIPIFGGIRANVSSNGVGWSWGVGIIRWGVSPNGKKWISVGIPGTGFRYFKYLNDTSSSYHDNNQSGSSSDRCTPNSFNERENRRGSTGKKPINQWKNLK